MSRRLDDVRLAVLMIDGIELKGRTNVVALGITTGPRHRAGRAVRARWREGAAQGGPRRARVHTPVQRCVRHKERNVLEHLPERDRPAIKRRLRRAWADTAHERALDALPVLAAGSIAPTPAGPPRSGRGWRRRSSSPASASAGR